MPSSPSCVFCRIASGEIPKEFVYRDEALMVFSDIHPVAPKHLLIVPVSHEPMSIAELTSDQEPLIGRMFSLARRMAEAEGIAADGYRLIFNVRRHGGQEVDHLHLHLIGGEVLGPIR